MRATRFNHVSIHAVDMEESLRFYIDVLGMERLPSPDFAQRVEWLRLGDQQLHLFLSETPAPELHHLGLDVDDFEAAYVMARERGLLDDDTFAPTVRQLNDGSVQMYLRDPAGNLIEIDWPDVTTLDRTVVSDIRHVRDERPQSASAQRARLYMER
ncbi:MAG: VOC family protein [Actinomycetota bacterium]|nr:VOC family protein [Actinomycetota bacterium]